MVSNLSDKKINTGRQSEVDMVKFLAIPFMICIHFYEQFGSFDHAVKVPDTFFRNAMEFAGGPLAAPVFMFSMGIGMIYTHHDSPREHIKRGWKLLLTGYLLNFFRQTLPQLIGLAMGIDPGIDIIGGLLCVDILPFAGMAFLTVGVMRKLKLSSIRITEIAFLLQAVGIWTTRLHMKAGVIQNLLGLIVPTGKWTSFPLTLWLVYPALGMVFGEVLIKCSDKDKMYRKLMICSAVFFAAFAARLPVKELEKSFTFSLKRSKCFWLFKYLFFPIPQLPNFLYVSDSVKRFTLSTTFIPTFVLASFPAPFPRT